MDIPAYWGGALRTANTAGVPNITPSAPGAASLLHFFRAVRRPNAYGVANTNCRREPSMKTTSGVANMRSELIAQIVAKRRYLLAMASTIAAIASAGPNTLAVSANRLKERTS